MSDLGKVEDPPMFEVENHANKNIKLDPFAKF